VLLLLLSYLAVSSLSQAKSATNTGSSTSTTSTVSTLSSSSASPTEGQQVSLAYLVHLDSIESENASLITTGYEGNATMKWEGFTQGLGGTYSGWKNISLTYYTLKSFLTSLVVGNLTDTVVNDSSNAPAVKGTFAIDYQLNHTTFPCANSGYYDGEISANTTYDYSDGQWLISNEVWNFLSFNIPSCYG